MIREIFECDICHIIVDVKPYATLTHYRVSLRADLVQCSSRGVGNVRPAGAGIELQTCKACFEKLEYPAGEHLDPVVPQDTPSLIARILAAWKVFV